MRPFSWGIYICVQAAFVALHFPTRKRIPRLASFIGLVVALLCTWSTTLSSPGDDYVLGCSNGIMLFAAIYTVFLDPDFPDGLGREQDDLSPSALPFFRKLHWMFDLSANMRRIGCTYSTKHNGTSSSDLASIPRWKFALTRLILCLVCIKTFHLCIGHRVGNPSFDPGVHQIPGDELYIRRKPLVLRGIDVLLWATVTAAEMTFLQSAAASLSVALGFSEPRDWPSLIGSPHHAYTVRRAWRQTWHQILRVPLRGYGQFVAYTVFGLDHGTTLSAYTQAFIAFLVSALIHIGGDLSVHAGLTRSGPTLRFFLLQPLAIAGEDMIIRIFQQHHINRVGFIIGYIWVFMWFSWCIPPWLDAISMAGGHMRTKMIAFKMLEYD